MLLHLFPCNYERRWDRDAVNIEFHEEVNLSFFNVPTSLLMNPWGLFEASAVLFCVGY